MTEPIIGIDLGTTNSAVGIVESGFPILLADNNSRRILPSAVYYQADGAIFVGHEAVEKHQLAQNTEAGTLVTSAKRLIGHDQTPECGYPLPTSFSDGTLKIQLPHQQVTAVEVSAEILKGLKLQAENQLSHPVKKAVITVPAYFNDSQRNATIEAANIAGLEVERILSEPTAAALAYGLDKLGESSKVVVYDLGGGTFDVSLLELSTGVFQVIATSGDTQLGGDDIDHLLAEHLWKKASSAPYHQLENTLKNTLISIAKKAKERLSHSVTEPISVLLPESLPCEENSIELNHHDFQKLISSLIQKTLHHCQKVLHDAEIKSSKDELSAVVLVGGSTRIPAIRKAVADFFGKVPDCSQHPDEAIGLGAVIQAGILSGAVKQMVLIDVTPLSLGIETYGGLMNVIIPRNSTIPCKAGEMFTNALDSQPSMKVKVLQGERELAKDNWELGDINVPFSPMPKGKARVGIQFSIDANGILEVLTRDTHTQTDTILHIHAAAVNVQDEKVERMVSESVEHAFTDMSARVFTEARLKAEELLPAVEMALEQAGDQLSEEDKNAIISTKGEVEQLLKGEDSTALKQAVQILDKQTEHLATILIEKAMEDALMKKL
ncbi:Hsp70 family protein [Akkermansiaceae bacterium]|nr:Hsp70 family protein [Akkermansiaceae bacterium]